MLFYLVTIFIANVIIIILNSFLFLPEIGVGFIALNTVIGTVGVIAVDGVGALIVRRLLPNKWFIAERRLFRVSKREHELYHRIRVKSWKDKVPELGMFTGFSKSNLKTTADAEYLARFIMEINYGVICHLENAFFGWLIMFIPFFIPEGMIFPAPVSIWAFIAAVNFVLSMLPVFILRYTSYTLTRMYERQMKNKKESSQSLKV